MILDSNETGQCKVDRSCPYTVAICHVRPDLGLVKVEDSRTQLATAAIQENDHFKKTKHIFGILLLMLTVFKDVFGIYCAICQWYFVWNL